MQSKHRQEPVSQQHLALFGSAVGATTSMELVNDETCYNVKQNGICFVAYMFSISVTGWVVFLLPPLTGRRPTPSHRPPRSFPACRCPTPSPSAAPLLPPAAAFSTSPPLPLPPESPSESACLSRSVDSDGFSRIRRPRTDRRLAITHRHHHPPSCRC